MVDHFKVPIMHEPTPFGWPLGAKQVDDFSIKYRNAHHSIERMRIIIGNFDLL